MNEAPEDGLRASTAPGASGASGPSPQADPEGLPKPPGAWQRALRGTWRVAVAEESMAPALLPADWLLLDPTVTRWPRHGSVVVFREPGTQILAIKRVAARPGDRVRISQGILHLAPDEAWLLGDNLGPSIDSRRYGPVPLEALVGRAWFRYGPAGRIGPIRRAQPSRPIERG